MGDNYKTQQERRRERAHISAEVTSAVIIQASQAVHMPPKCIRLQHGAIWYGMVFLYMILSSRLPDTLLTSEPRLNLSVLVFLLDELLRLIAGAAE